MQSSVYSVRLVGPGYAGGNGRKAGRCASVSGWGIHDTPSIGPWPHRPMLGGWTPGREILSVGNLPGGRPGIRPAKPAECRIRVERLLEVTGNQLGHLEHGHRLLAVEDFLQLFVGVDVALVLAVL